MDLHQLKDAQLLTETKRLVENERDVLTKILHHLREIDKRKLYVDLGYPSLFEYAVKELQYSEGQAGRRIQAMRLVKEIPQLEKSIASGELSLTNISQAQSLFRSMAKENPSNALPIREKISIINSLKNKSSREGQKELVKLQPNLFKAQERERVFADDMTEVRFVMTEELKRKLERVKALLGTKAINMNYAELFSEMAELSARSLEENKFGKKRVQAAASTPSPEPEPAKPGPSGSTKNSRYIPKAVQHYVWQRDLGRCSKCGSQKNLNIDHVKPVALGGKSEPTNLRLLCFNCNQRAAIKTFGVGNAPRSW